MALLQQRSSLVTRRAAFSGSIAPCRATAVAKRPGKVRAYDDEQQEEERLLREWSPTNKRFIELGETQNPSTSYIPSPTYARELLG